MTDAHIVPTGTYRGRAVSGDFQTSTKQGTPFIHVMCEITDGEYKGRRLPCSLFLGPKEESAERALRSLQYCGVDMADPFKLIGIDRFEVDLQVEVEDPQPKPGSTTGEMYAARSRVAWINEPGSSVLGKAMTPQEGLTTAAKLMALRAKMNLSTKTAPTTEATPGGTTAASQTVVTPPAASANGGAPAGVKAPF